MITLSGLLEKFSPLREGDPQPTTHREKPPFLAATSSYESDRVLVMDQDFALRSPQEYQPLQIPPLEAFPQAAECAKPREKEIHDVAISVMHQHANGLSDAFYNHYAKLGWVSEQMAFFDPRVREYIGKPGSLHDQMAEIISSLNPNEQRLLVHATLCHSISRSFPTTHSKDSSFLLN